MAAAVTVWTGVRLAEASRRWAAGEPIKTIAAAMGLSEPQVRDAAHYYRSLFPERRPRCGWTEAEIDRAAQMWAGGVRIRLIAAALGRTDGQVVSLAAQDRQRFPRRQIRLGAPPDATPAPPPRDTQPEIPQGDMDRPAPLPSAPPAGLGELTFGKGARVDVTPGRPAGEVVTLSLRLPARHEPWEDHPQQPRPGGCRNILGAVERPFRADSWRWCNAPRALSGVYCDACAQGKYRPAQKPQHAVDGNAVTTALPTVLPQKKKPGQRVTAWE